MIPDPDFLITVDRTDLALAALAISNDRTTPLTLTRYREPALQPRIRYAPSSDYAHGDEALSWSWDQTLLAFDVSARDAATEDAGRAAVAALVVAVTRLRYLVTVTPAGAAPETWLCDPGTVTPADDRTYVDLRDHDPIWVVTIPCHPVRSL